jgi:hypothetical protein
LEVATRNGEGQGNGYIELSFTHRIFLLNILAS